MSAETFLDGRMTMWPGDMLAVLPLLAENSVDACVCDPPYHLHSIVKRFAKTGRTDKTRSKSGPHQRTARGFMNKQWDGGDVAFRVETWEQVFRVLKPGGYVVAFSSSRTFGRMSVALEDAGFITHPLICWIFGQGFPKAHNAARAVDRALGLDGGKIANGAAVRRIRPGADQNKEGTWDKLEDRTYQPGSYEPATPEAELWNGWAYGGQALKPALEPIYCGQKPFSEANGALNLLKWGTGALNIGACRVGTEGGTRGCDAGPSNGILGDGLNGSFGKPVPGLGRWPANICHDGSDEVVGAFPTTGVSRTGYAETETSAARFFYTAKADADDRLGSKHPTVKPLDLMQWLVRLVTPKGGTVLDPFAGTGTTGEAAFREGMRAILIEREPEYQADIRRRMALVLGGPEERRNASLRASGKALVHDVLPLFGGAA